MHTHRSRYRFPPALTAAAALLLALHARAAADEFEGEFRCKGVDTTGTPYSGSARIVKSGEVYNVSWNLSGVKYVGVGVRVGDVLAVSYYGKFSGVIAYQLEGDGLLGKWTTAPAKGPLGRETLTR